MNACYRIYKTGLVKIVCRVCVNTCRYGAIPFYMHFFVQLDFRCNFQDIFDKNTIGKIPILFKYSSQNESNTKIPFFILCDFFVWMFVWSSWWKRIWNPLCKVCQHYYQMKSEESLHGCATRSQNLPIKCCVCLFLRLSVTNLSQSRFRRVCSL